MRILYGTKKYDIIFTIATPAAMSVYSATKETDVPVVFTAGTDPVSAGIAESIEQPGLGVTGMSDVIDYNQQLQMIRDFMPNTKK